MQSSHGMIQVGCLLLFWARIELSTVFSESPTGNHGRDDDHDHMMEDESLHTEQIVRNIYTKYKILYEYRTQVHYAKRKVESGDEPNNSSKRRRVDQSNERFSYLFTLYDIFKALLASFTPQISSSKFVCSMPRGIGIQNVLPMFL